MAKIKEKKPLAAAIAHQKDKDALIHMSYAPKIDEDAHTAQMLPAAFFTAFVIIITRMHVYNRDMGQFFWSGQGDNAQLSDFFSYFKMVAIVICATLAILFLLYRVFTQALYIQKSVYYYPMVLYSLLVILSYAFSDFKEFALWGYNDRFEGTVTLLAYMVMLFYIINTVRTERNVKWIIYPVAASSFLLGMLGVSQAGDFDFFRTAFGKKLITPSWFWDQVDSLNFTFQNKEIYQTVYNINYVSFYLTLLIPLFGLLFIYSMTAGKEDRIYKKLIWGLLFGLAVFNLIGSASSGGLMGMAVVVLVAAIVLNKRILQWWKPIGILVIITLLIGGLTFQRWMPEFTGALNSAFGKATAAAPEIAAPEATSPAATSSEAATEEATSSEAATKEATSTAATSQAVVAAEKEMPKLDYLDTDGNEIRFSVGGNEAVITVYPEDPEGVKITDKDGKKIDLIPTAVSPIYQMDDKRFSTCLLQPAQDENGANYFIFTSDLQKQQWPFRITENGMLFLNGVGVLVDLDKVPAIGWKNNQEFGSGRGYIFSRSIPMMKDTLILGHGADTYCLFFPHKDYVGKYNSGTFSGNINIVVDKPHDMYIDSIIGTGMLSLLALLALWGIYIVQSGRLYFRSKFETFNEYVGAAIMFGVCGFLAAGLVNDSTVSTVPMFYGLLGTGIAINMMLKRQIKKG